MDERLESILPFAGQYRQLLGVMGQNQCKDPRRLYTAVFPWTERHLQCIWFDSRLRPPAFTLENGERVTILNPGEWNLEAGPDFLHATLLVDPGARQVCGDVEIHVRPEEWERHRHARSTAYSHVVAHVTWFPGARVPSLPRGCCQFSLCEPLLSRPGFSLDDIDLKAYPHAILPESPRPCESFLAHNQARAQRLLTAAGQYRLRAKALRLLQRLQLVGNRYQLFYEEVMAALGFKRNSGAFRLLSKRVPYTLLQRSSREETLARLLGAADLLPLIEGASDEGCRKLIRTLWKIWWEGSGNLPPLSPIPWERGNIRPQNAPSRRIAAAAALFSGTPPLLDQVDSILQSAGDRLYAQIERVFTERSAWPFWDHRLSFSSPPEKRRTRLLGAPRISSIVTNTIIPLALAEGVWPESRAILHLHAEELSAPMRLTAWYLFGRDHNPAWYTGNGLLQQGLLQIYLDFCINARPDCSSCPLAERLHALDEAPKV